LHLSTVTKAKVRKFRNRIDKRGAGNKKKTSLKEKQDVKKRSRDVEFF
jgi:hypothetical protein